MVMDVLTHFDNVAFSMVFVEERVNRHRVERLSTVLMELWESAGFLDSIHALLLSMLRHIHCPTHS